MALIGPDASLRSQLRAALDGEESIEEIIELASLAELRGESPGPGVALVDATELDDARVVATLARIELLWPATQLIVVVRDADPALVRSVLDAGGLSLLLAGADAGQTRSTVLAAMEGRGLLDVSVVRPVIDVHALLLSESRRRDRGVIESLVAAVEAKDSITSRHLRHVSRLAIGLAEQVDPHLARSDDFLDGCLLHDVGKIGVPETILMKPAALTAQEWDVMRRHPRIGARVVRPLRLSPTVLDMILYHHERWDGTGYPEGLGGEEIPLVARIFSICDALEAMTAARPYRAALPTSVAFERVRLEAGRQFDPAIVDVLARAVRARAIDLGDHLDDAAAPRSDRGGLVGFPR
ncbi:MAG: HD-GYP domain-containing protein [Solirubrobacterales bacterium]|nr:HD-GYP domain-containing protein [Solirubrobacterales bacterium]